MKSRPGLAFLLIYVGLALLTSQLGSGIASAGGMLALSFPHVGLMPDEWIGDYECTLQGVHVVAIREIPYVWSTKITNEKRGRTEIASAHVLGTGRMGKDPIEQLKELFVLKQTTRAEKTPLSVNCKLYVENSHNDDLKLVKLDTRQVSVAPVNTIPLPEPPYRPDLKWFAVSVPPFALTDKERIVMFELGVKSGRVVSVKNIPNLWFVSATNNDAGSFTGVYGETLADSAALGENDFGMFDRFVTVERHAEDARHFQIRAKMKIRTGPKHYRYMRFNTRQLTLTPVSYSGYGRIRSTPSE